MDKLNDMYPKFVEKYCGERRIASLDYIKYNLSKLERLDDENNLEFILFSHIYNFRCDDDSENNVKEEK